MAAISFDVQLLGSAYEGDELEVATWIVDPDGASDWLGSFRYFTGIRPDAARGHLNSSVPTSIRKAVRMPQIFKETYVMVSEPVVSV